MNIALHVPHMTSDLNVIAIRKIEEEKTNNFINCKGVHSDEKY